MTDGLTPRQRAQRDAAARKPEAAPGTPADYYGPRIEGQQPNLCHRHKRTIPLGLPCDFGREEADPSIGLPSWAEIDPAKPCFNNGGAA
ncbi:hypothetical protein GCM10022232_68900 [Streptomyces plumbiresistens]|uniref:Uncharacterized protein n=1 Tax=Streptomyces plumbiresistens TaxID=511811 RepID=A0ABP7SSP1_9ACTN